MVKSLLIWLLTTFLLTTVLPAEAQQPKVYSVGLLSLGTTVSAEIKGLRDGLREARYVEGKNLLLDVGLAKTYDELRPIAKSYVEKKFDVIVSTGASAPLIAKELSQHIPIVLSVARTPFKQDSLNQWHAPKEILPG